MDKVQNNLPRLREAGEVHKAIMVEVAEIITKNYISFTTADVDAFIDKKINETDMVPAFKGVPGYDHASCISVNGVVVHGVPNDTDLRAGDYITVDFGVANNGWIVDAATTWVVGQEKPDELIQAAIDVRTVMIEKAVANTRAMDLALAAQPLSDELAKSGMYIMPHFTGHGVRKNELHTTPCIPCVPVNKKIPTYDHEHQCLREMYRLQDGDVICIEPIIIETKASRKKRFSFDVMPDGWTVKLSDKRAIAVHCEHTVYVTKGEPEILA